MEEDLVWQQGWRGGQWRGLPGPRPLPKKWKRTLGTVVQTVLTDFAQVLGEAASTDVLDKRRVVRERVVRSEVRTFSHIPPETKFLGLDPVVGDALEGAGVLGRGAEADLTRRGTSTSRFVRDGRCGWSEGGDQAGPVLGALQILFQE